MQRHNTRGAQSRCFQILRAMSILDKGATSVSSVPISLVGVNFRPLSYTGNQTAPASVSLKLLDRDRLQFGSLSTFEWQDLLLLSPLIREHVLHALLGLLIKLSWISTTVVGRATVEFWWTNMTHDNPFKSSSCWCGLLLRLYLYFCFPVCRKRHLISCWCFWLKAAEVVSKVSSPTPHQALMNDCMLYSSLTMHHSYMEKPSVSEEKKSLNQISLVDSVDDLQRLQSKVNEVNNEVSVKMNVPPPTYLTSW